MDSLARTCDTFLSAFRLKNRFKGLLEEVPVTVFRIVAISLRIHIAIRIDGQNPFLFGALLFRKRGLIPFTEIFQLFPDGRERLHEDSALKGGLDLRQMVQILIELEIPRKAYRSISRAGQ